MKSGERRVALIVTLVGGVAFVVIALLLVPWHPVPGGTPSPVPAESVFSAEQIARAEEFSRWARVWSWSSLAVSLVVALVIGFSSWGRRLVNRLPGWWWVRIFLAVAVIELIGRIITLPFAVLLRRRVLDYGLSTQSWGGFALDMVKHEAVTIVVTSLLLIVLVGCARRWQRAWPAVAGGLLGVLVLAGSFVYPVVIEPLFNTFTPLPDGPLRTQILALAEQEDVPVDDVLVADASRRTTTLNAYVSGFGSTRRVVLYDNLVNDVPQDEVLSVVAHELGHAKHDDVLTGSLLGAAGAVFGVGLLALVVGAVGERRSLSMRDPAVAPLVLALLALGTLLSSPIENGISRLIETRADVDALEVTHDADSFVEVQRQLALRSLADPTPPAWSQLWFGSHPTGLTRIAIAHQLAGRLAGRPAGVARTGYPGRDGHPIPPDAASEHDSSHGASPLPGLRGDQEGNHTIMLEHLRNLLHANRSERDERGASAVEYGLLVAGIAALIVAVVFLFGGMIRDVRQDVYTIQGSGTAASVPPHPDLGLVHDLVRARADQVGCVMSTCR